ncbi:antimicrobial response protein [Lithospermum erythrorhizon]|uniref:Antimicrobial response protein n=1 Tax=Lithospermum erythrorhizon TaxID=34254 RepID=A0AAV3RY29_LITER
MKMIQAITQSHTEAGTHVPLLIQNILKGVFERDSMVQLWIAEEVIDGEATERLEDKGYICLQILLSQGYIEQSGLLKGDDHLKYKVSEYYANRGSLVDDFLIINKDGFSNISRMPLHLSLPAERFDCQIPNIIQMCQRLRTLLLLGECKYLVKQVPRDLFLSLNLLRTLVLSGTQVSEVPSSVGHLEDLRYFDLSGTLIRELPGVLCDLVSLQTLKLRDCFRFIALPKGMKKLINLRHLDLDIVRQLSYMPKSMGRLVNLQTFKGFIVGTDEECAIGELCRLNNITGSFCISCLENVLNVEEAKMADLKSKSYITKLVLRWEECINAEAEQEILECLLPHPNLSELQIQFFSGSALPSWMSDPSFTMLINITLYKCINCSFLPRIGNLLSLKILRIFGMDKVIDIDCMFCCNPQGSSYLLSFPSLEELIIENMSQLEKWTLIGTDDLPCLRHLSIRNCPRLVELPSMSSLYSLKYLELNSFYELEWLPDMPASLETLIIQDCQKLQEQCRKGEGRDWPKFAHVPNIWIQHRQISPISSL